jgi:dihydrofolate reductase
MTKVIAAINMTLDGYCDHTGGIADEALHEHYSQLIRHGGAILYGSVTYRLMQYWQDLIHKPTGNKSIDDFALAIDNIPKIVFSKSLNTLYWDTAKLASSSIKTEISRLKKEMDRDILIGSPSLIIQSMKLGLVDELQLCVHPVILGSGLPLFKDITNRTLLKLLKTKTLPSGAIILYYAPN